MFLSHPVWKLLFHTPTKRQTRYPRFAIPSSTIRVTKHHFSSFFLKFSLSSRMLCSALLSPPEFSAPPLPDLSSWSHGSLSPEGFSCIEVWSLKDLGFENVDLTWSDLDFKIWVLYFSLTFERFGVWKCWFEIWFGFYLGLGITKFWCLKLGFDCIYEGLDDFVRVWNNKSWRFGRV